jgi:hypothetical protein
MPLLLNGKKKKQDNAFFKRIEKQRRREKAMKEIEYGKSN